MTRIDRTIKSAPSITQQHYHQLGHDAKLKCSEQEENHKSSNTSPLKPNTLRRATLTESIRYYYSGLLPANVQLIVA